jgi:hypothetical protein
MFRRLALFCLVILSAAASAQVPISASQVTDASERPLVSAKLCFAPVDAAEKDTGFRVGSIQVVPGAVCGLITSGALQSGLNLAPNAVGTYYHVWAANRASNAVLRDYGMTQITGPTWTLDTYDPSLAVLPVSTISVGTVTTLPPGSSATATIVNGGSGSYLLDLGVPQGPAGVDCTSIIAGTCTMDIPIVLPADPTSALEAVTKEYVDAATGADLPANGATSEGTGASNTVTFPGTVAAGTESLGGGPRLDITFFGAFCDNTHFDDAAIQAALNIWVAGGYTLAFPTGKKCLVHSPLTAAFAASPAQPLIIDFRGGTLHSQNPSGTDLHIYNSAANVYTSDVILRNGSITDDGLGANVIVDADGGSTLNAGMSRVLLDNMTITANAYTTTAFQTENTFQSACFNSRVYGPNTALSSTVLGYNGYALLYPGSGQNTGDWTFLRCESFGFDHGLYVAPNVNEVKVISGTYLQSFEEPVFLQGISSAKDVHVENGWMNNPTGGGGYRAGLYCGGRCVIDNVTSATSTGNENAAVRVYSGSQSTSRISGGYMYGYGTNGIIYAWVGGASDNEIDITGIPMVSNVPSYAINTGTPNLLVLSAGGIYKAANIAATKVNGWAVSGTSPWISQDQSAIQQWLATAPVSGSTGFTMFGQASTGAAVSEQYFAVRYSPTSFGAGGFFMDGSHAWNFDWCGGGTMTAGTYLSGVPTGCVTHLQFIPSGSGSNLAQFDFTNLFSGSTKLQFDPSGGIAPMFPSGSVFSSGCIPYYTNTSGHLSSTCYSSTNQIPANMVNITGSGNVVGYSDQTGLTANAAATTVYTLGASPSITFYQVCISEVETAAATTSSTLPTPQIKWTDADTNTVITENVLVAGYSATTNAIGTVLSGCTQIHAAASTAIQVLSGGYAASPANGMIYAFHATATTLR